MADLRDGFLAAVLAYLASGERLELLTAPTDCCPGRVTSGPAGCTCWEPVFDVDETNPDTDTADAVARGEIALTAPDWMCDNCAYRPSSPEKRGQASHAADAAELERLAATGERFYCHVGLRTPLAWRHPAGRMIPADPDRHDDYQPPIVHGVPFRLDGEPALLCAGWAARRRALNAGIQRHG